MIGTAVTASALGAHDGRRHHRGGDGEDVGGFPGAARRLDARRSIGVELDGIDVSLGRTHGAGDRAEGASG